MPHASEVVREDSRGLSIEAAGKLWRFPCPATAEILKADQAALKLLFEGLVLETPQGDPSKPHVGYSRRVSGGEHRELDRFAVQSCAAADLKAADTQAYLRFKANQNEPTAIREPTFLRLAAIIHECLDLPNGEALLQAVNVCGAAGKVAPNAWAIIARDLERPELVDHAVNTILTNYPADGVDHNHKIAEVLRLLPELAQPLMPYLDPQGRSLVQEALAIGQSTLGQFNRLECTEASLIPYMAANDAVKALLGANYVTALSGALGHVNSNGAMLMTEPVSVEVLETFNALSEESATLAYADKLKRQASRYGFDINTRYGRTLTRLATMMNLEPSESTVLSEVVLNSLSSSVRDTLQRELDCNGLTQPAIKAYYAPDMLGNLIRQSRERKMTPEQAFILGLNTLAEAYQQARTVLPHLPQGEITVHLRDVANRANRPEELRNCGIEIQAVPGATVPTFRAVTRFPRAISDGLKRAEECLSQGKRDGLQVEADSDMGKIDRRLFHLLHLAYGGSQEQGALGEVLGLRFREARAVLRRIEALVEAEESDSYVSLDRYQVRKVEFLQLQKAVSAISLQTQAILETHAPVDGGEMAHRSLRATVSRLPALADTIYRNRSVSAQVECAEEVEIADVITTPEGNPHIVLSLDHSRSTPFTTLSVNSDWEVVFQQCDAEALGFGRPDEGSLPTLIRESPDWLISPVVELTLSVSPQDLSILTPVGWVTEDVPIYAAIDKGEDAPYLTYEHNGSWLRVEQASVRRRWLNDSEPLRLSENTSMAVPLYGKQVLPIEILLGVQWKSELQQTAEDARLDLIGADRNRSYGMEHRVARAFSEQIEQVRSATARLMSAYIEKLGIRDKKSEQKGYYKEAFEIAQDFFEKATYAAHFVNEFAKFVPADLDMPLFEIATQSNEIHPFANEMALLRAEVDRMRYQVEWMVEQVSEEFQEEAAAFRSNLMLGWGECEMMAIRVNQWFRTVASMSQVREPLVADMRSQPFVSTELMRELSSIVPDRTEQIRLQGNVEKGAKILTARGKGGELLGCGVYFEHQDVPRVRPDTYDIFERYGCVAALEGLYTADNQDRDTLSAEILDAVKLELAPSDILVTSGEGESPPRAEPISRRWQFFAAAESFFLRKPDENEQVVQDLLIDNEREFRQMYTDIVAMVIQAKELDDERSVPEQISRNLYNLCELEYMSTELQHALRSAPPLDAIQQCAIIERLKGEVGSEIGLPHEVEKRLAPYILHRTDVLNSLESHRRRLEAKLKGQPIASLRRLDANELSDEEQDRVCAALSQLTESNPYRAGSPKTWDFGTSSRRTSPGFFRELLQNGASIVACEDPDGALVGYSLSLPPKVVWKYHPNIPQRYRHYGTTGFVVNIVIVPALSEIKIPVYSMLSAALTFDLSKVDVTVGYAVEDNERAQIAHSARGRWHLMAGDLRRSVSDWPIRGDHTFEFRREVTSVGYVYPTHALLDFYMNCAERSYAQIVEQARHVVRREYPGIFPQNWNDYLNKVRKVAVRVAYIQDVIDRNALYAMLEGNPELLMSDSSCFTRAAEYAERTFPAHLVRHVKGPRDWIYPKTVDQARDFVGRFGEAIRWTARFQKHLNQELGELTDWVDRQRDYLESRLGKKRANLFMSYALETDFAWPAYDLQEF